jgi:serine/threonine protein kinase
MPGMLKKMFSGKAKAREKMLANVETEIDPSARWKIVGDLGEGSFGMVHKVKHAETGMLAAAKIIPVDNDEELADAVVEVDILRKCEHEHIVGLHGAFLWKDKLWIIMELCEGGALDDVLLSLESGLSEPQLRAVALQMLKALAHLHKSHVIHRDMKAGNILLLPSGKVKLTDFGVSALMSSGKLKRDTFIGTPYWMAPEVIICENIRDRPYTTQADMWSLGITLLELAEMSPPFHDLHPMRVLFKIPKSPPPTLKEPSNW